ncbi:MAG: DUF4911 domain-containing protein [Deferrisomatales bacterium]
MPKPPAEVQAICRLARSDLVYLRHTLEAYDGLCIPTTPPGRTGEVRLLTTADRREELAAVLQALAAEFPLQIEAWEVGTPGEEELPP